MPTRILALLLAADAVGARAGQTLRRRRARLPRRPRTSARAVARCVAGALTAGICAAFHGRAAPLPVRQSAGHAPLFALIRAAYTVGARAGQALRPEAAATAVAHRAAALAVTQRGTLAVIFGIGAGWARHASSLRAGLGAAVTRSAALRAAEPVGATAAEAFAAGGAGGAVRLHAHAPRPADLVALAVVLRVQSRRQGRTAPLAAQELARLADPFTGLVAAKPVGAVAAQAACGVAAGHAERSRAVAGAVADLGSTAGSAGVLSARRVHALAFPVAKSACATSAGARPLAADSVDTGPARTLVGRRTAFVYGAQHQASLAGAVEAAGAALRPGAQLPARAAGSIT